jgi:hypothetical protein
VQKKTRRIEQLEDEISKLPKKQTPKKKRKLESDRLELLGLREEKESWLDDKNAHADNLQVARCMFFLSVCLPPHRCVCWYSCVRVWCVGLCVVCVLVRDTCVCVLQLNLVVLESHSTGFGFHPQSNEPRVLLCTTFQNADHWKFELQAAQASSQATQLTLSNLTVENARLTAANAGLDATQKLLLTMQTAWSTRNAELQKKLGSSVPLDVFKVVQSASSQPILNAIRAIQGHPEPENSAHTHAGPPVSTEDVATFLEGLGWRSKEVSLLTDQNVNGDVLLHDLTPEICSGYGIPSLRLKTLTRHLEQWAPEWGKG